MSQRFGERVRTLGALGGGPALVQNWLKGLGSVTAGAVGIRSIQFSGINPITPITLATAVTPANCILLQCGQLAPDLATPDIFTSRLTLTSSTQVTLTSYNPVAGLSSVFFLLEFLPGVIKNRYTGVITIGSGLTTQNATIPAVNLARALPFPVGFASNRAASLLNTNLWSAWHFLGSATTVTAARTTANTDIIDVGYQIIEFN